MAKSEAGGEKTGERRGRSIRDFLASHSVGLFSFPLAEIPRRAAAYRSRSLLAEAAMSFSSRFRRVSSCFALTTHQPIVLR